MDITIAVLPAGDKASTRERNTPLPVPVREKLEWKWWFVFPALAYSGFATAYWIFILRDDIDLLSWRYRAIIISICTILGWLAILPFNNAHVPFVIVQFIAAVTWELAGASVPERSGTTLSECDYWMHLASFIIQIVVGFFTCLYNCDRQAGYA